MLRKAGWRWSDKSVPRNSRGAEQEPQHPSQPFPALLRGQQRPVCWGSSPVPGDWEPAVCQEMWQDRSSLDLPPASTYILLAQLSKVGAGSQGLSWFRRSWFGSGINWLKIVRMWNLRSTGWCGRNTLSLLASPALVVAAICARLEGRTGQKFISGTPKVETRGNGTERKMQSWDLLCDWHSCLEPAQRVY